MLFTDILSRDDWLSLMDYLVTYKEHPELFIFFIVSYLSYFKVSLMKLTNFEEH